MYCKNCGSEISKEAYICPKCGVKIKEEQKEDTPSIGFNILSIIFPIIGLVLYFTWKDKTPNKAKSVLTCAIIGWAIGILTYILGN